MNKCRTHWNKNNITEYTLSPIEEQEATTFYQTEDSAIPNALISTNEQKAATSSSSESIIILNTPKPTNEAEANEQEAATYHCSGDNIFQNAAFLDSSNEQESCIFHWIVESEYRIVESALKSINRQKTTTFSQNESSIIQNTPTNKQGIATAHYSAVNIIQNALKSVNEQKAVKPLSSSQLKRFDKANSTIDNKENESTSSSIMELTCMFPKSNINSNTANRNTNDSENLQNDSIFALNPLKRSKALANFKDVDDSAVPYVLQKEQKREDKKTND
nr:PREDICTED: uncharacterized protein LOC105679952 [Linepithema humile]XP_012235718.1 PREDICTED: uncharacterized protein LOC105679952 [Linepithema humile]